MFSDRLEAEVTPDKEKAGFEPDEIEEETPEADDAEDSFLGKMSDWIKP